MTMPTRDDIDQKEDFFNAKYTAFRDAVIGLYQEPWTRPQAAQLARMVANKERELCQVLARSCGILDEDGGSFEEIAGMLEWQCDNPTLTDRWAEDEDYRRALRKVAG